MSRFWKKFLREGHGLFSGSKPGIYLGAFGKHPGWDDHIDDIGLETESLLLAKQLLYVEGIAGQINSGDWETLDNTRCLPAFDHLLLWKRGDTFLMAKIWSSSDGKKRTKFPMIVCAQCLNIPFGWAQLNVWPALGDLERQCKETRDPARVGALLVETLHNLRRSLATADAAPTLENPDGAEFIAGLDQGKNGEGFHRILYCLHTQLAGWRFGGDGLRPGQIRLPAAIEYPAETLLFWIRFLEGQFGADAPLLLALPLRKPWLDATIGEPTPKGR
jgi:hypothetical protein